MNAPVPDDIYPFAHRAWNQTSAKACALELLWTQERRVPSRGRPDAIVALDRRNRGTVLHDAARLSLHLLFHGTDKRSGGVWPNAEKVVRLVLQRGGGRDMPGSDLGYMEGKGYPELWDALGELVPKARLFQENFKFSADNRIGSEYFVAIDAQGQVVNYFDVPPGGYHGRIDWAEMAGKNDPVPNQLTVIDFKNRPAIHPRHELRSHEQLSFYAWMLAKQYPQSRLVPVKIGIYYFEYGVLNVEELTWDEIDVNVERLLIRIKAKQALRIVDVVAEPGFGRCQYCEHLVDCPEGLRVLDGKAGPIVDRESAEAAARSLFVLDELRKATREGLRTYVEQHGPVMISSDTGAGFKKTEEREWNAKAVVTVLRAQAIDPYLVLRVAKTPMTKLIKEKGEELAKAVEGLEITLREGSEFEIFKPKPDSKIMTTPRVTGRVRTKKDKKPKDKKAEPGVVLTPRLDGDDSNKKDES